MTGPPAAGRPADDARPAMLAVTGDDFGLTPGVSAGIVHAHRHGILTHASLMASAPFAAGAIDLARRLPSLAVGVHLLLVDGRPVLSPRHVSTLVGDDGRFRPAAGAFVRRWVAARVSAAEVERELRAQIEWVLATGLRPTHLDSHKHAHMWPPVFEVVARLAQEYGIPLVRVSFERPAVRLVLENLRDRRARKQALDNLAMAPFGWLNRRVLERHGVTASIFLGRVHTGLLSTAGLARAFPRLPGGRRAELMTHPGFVDEALGAVRTRLRKEREAELALLCAPETREALRRSGVQLDRRAILETDGLAPETARPA